MEVTEELSEAECLSMIIEMMARELADLERRFALQNDLISRLESKIEELTEVKGSANEGEIDCIRSSDLIALENRLRILHGRMEESDV